MGVLLLRHVELVIERHVALGNLLVGSLLGRILAAAPEGAHRRTGLGGRVWVIEKVLVFFEAPLLLPKLHLALACGRFFILLQAPLLGVEGAIRAVFVVDDIGHTPGGLFFEELM